jgi:rubrerythrin
MANTGTHAELGLNRTGVSTSPHLTKEMIEGTAEFPPSSGGDEQQIALARGEYAREADPLGSVPPPLTPHGVVKVAGTALKGESPTQLIDKLGERLAFERTGTRLYEGIVSKLDALGTFAGGPTREELLEILMDEYKHFRMLQQVVERLGADPTVMTPSADLHATMSKGLLEVVVDPRTSLAECLEAALLAELADNDCWSALKELALQAGEDDLVERFAAAFAEENTHLSRVREWLAAAQGRPRA